MKGAEASVRVHVRVPAEGYEQGSDRARCLMQECTMLQKGSWQRAFCLDVSEIKSMGQMHENWGLHAAFSGTNSR